MKVVMTITARYYSTYWFGCMGFDERHGHIRYHGIEAPEPYQADSTLDLPSPHWRGRVVAGNLETLRP